jgi:hypothetical protein
MGQVKILLLVAIATALIGCASTGQKNVTVLVTGIGSTVEEARRAAFRDAIQLANGSLNISERRVVNDQLFEDDVSYARGVIDSFQEVSRTIDPKDRQHRIQMSVTVSPTAIQKRLLAAQDSKSVSGNEIGRQIDRAQQQISSEVDRYMAARRLFEHITSGMATTLFDVTTGQVETVRNGANISTFVVVTFSLNPKVLQSLCATATEYQLSRTAGIPNNFRSNLSYFSLRHAYDCSIRAEVEPSHMASIARDLDSLGICLALEDGAGQRLHRVFYQPQSPQLVKSALQYLDWRGQHINKGAYLLRGYRRSGIYYPTAVVLVRHAWGNDEKIRLELPQLSTPVLQRLAKISATLSNDEGCSGPKPRASTPLGLRLVGHPGSIVVENVIPNSPAQRAGFMEGDQIISIDHTSVSGFTVQQSGARLTGKSRSFVTVEVFRKSLNDRGLLRIAVP